MMSAQKSLTQKRQQLREFLNESSENCFVSLRRRLIMIIDDCARWMHKWMVGDYYAGVGNNFKKFRNILF
jgi:hypothetical protein